MNEYFLFILILLEINKQEEIVSTIFSIKFKHLIKITLAY
jgi:hypothetical protein